MPHCISVSDRDVKIRLDIGRGLILSAPAFVILKCDTLGLRLRYDEVVNEPPPLTRHSEPLATRESPRFTAMPIGIHSGCALGMTEGVLNRPL